MDDWKLTAQAVVKLCEENTFVSSYHALSCFPADVENAKRKMRIKLRNQLVTNADSKTTSKVFAYILFRTLHVVDVALSKFRVSHFVPDLF